MRDVSIGQYYPSNSVVHKLDPRAKLIFVVAYIVFVFFIDTFVGYGLFFVMFLIMVFLAKVPLLKVLRSLRAIMFLILFTLIMSVLFYRGDEADLIYKLGFLRVYKSALIISAKMALRIMLLVLGPSILTLTTTPVELTDAFERLLKPLSYIKFPVHELAIIMSIALRLIPALVEDTDRIISAQKARLAEFESRNLIKRAKALLPVLIPLFVSSFRRADELAYAIDSRCYRGAKGRTRMKVMKLSIRDLVAFIFLASFFFSILALRYNFFDLAFIELIRTSGY